jgi:hypothetical protein
MLSISCGELIGVGDDYITCSIPADSPIVVTGGDSGGRSYTYDMSCSYVHEHGGNSGDPPSYTRDYPTAHVRAGFSQTSHSASERLDDGVSTLQVSWICTADPWTANTQPNCAFGTASTKPIDEGLFDLSHSTYPFSAAYLDADSQSRLSAAQLSPTSTPLIN